MIENTLSKKVACYITRGDQLLVFDHTEFPEAGTQVPAGSVESGETLELAALREAREESGLTDLALRAYLGTKDYDLAPLGKPEIHQRHYFHLECLAETPERWLSYEETPSDGSPGPIELEFYWVPLPWSGSKTPTPVLSGWQDDFFPRLEMHLTSESLMDIIRRQPAPEPWSEGEHIPWNEPEFSARMLKEHLSQAHDAASRRSTKIDRHIAWIHQHALESQPTRLLDLGCGPGLYASRLTRLGHTVTGIDFSPASIAYASEQANLTGQSINYIHADLRRIDFGQGYQAAMLVFGEFNIFPPQQAEAILRKIFAALQSGGRLILEPHTPEILQEIGAQPRSWHSSPGGLFADYPHLMLEEHSWDADQRTATTRFFVVDATHGTVLRYAQSLQAYNQAQYADLLAACGFTQITFYPSLTGEIDPEQPGLLAILARKPTPGQLE